MRKLHGYERRVTNLIGNFQITKTRRGGFSFSVGATTSAEAKTYATTKLDSFPVKLIRFTVSSVTAGNRVAKHESYVAYVSDDGRISKFAPNNEKGELWEEVCDILCRIC